MSAAAVLPDRLGAGRDAAFAALMRAHEGLSEADSHALNARLVLLMMNEIGDAERLEALFALARAKTGPIAR
jgi:hypothetical protein